MMPFDAPSPPERLRIGQCTVNVASREIYAPDARRPFRVTPKAMAVLLALVDSADRVVSRDALLTAVWPDTLPSDDVLTQAVTQLRKAFRDVRADPQYIETIAKGGYRLVAEVEYLDGSAPEPVASAASTSVEAPVAGATPAPIALAPTPGSAKHWQRWQVAVLVLMVFAMLLGGAWWLSREQTVDQAARTAESAALTLRGIEPFLITSAPGFELAPTLSPGGGLVAYMAVPQGQKNIAIMLQTTAPVAPRQLTFPEGMAEDASPRWSPDGRDIAFLRVTQGRECRLLVIRATGSGERSVLSCDPDNQPGYDWTPDSRGLILDRGEVPGLQVLDLASGLTRAIDYEADPEHLDASPRYSPDGRWIVFLRGAPMRDFWRIPAGGGAAEQLTSIGAEILGWDWTPDSNGLVYARRKDGVSRLYRFDISTDTHVDLGVEDAEEPTMSRNAPSLAYVLRNARFGIYRFTTDDGTVERLFASSGRDRVPSIAPDGRQLVFISNRAGPFGLWWGDVDEPGSARLLEGIQPDSRQPAAWSHDSTRVLLIGSQSGDAGAAGNGVYEVDPESGRVTRLNLPVTDPVQVAYAPGPAGPDQRLLVVADRGDGRLRLNLFDAVERPYKALATLDDVSRVQVDAARGRLVFALLSDPGLFQADLDLDPASIRPVELDAAAARWYHAWSVAEDGGIYLVRRAPTCAALLTHDHGGQSTAAGRASSDREPLCLDSARRAATRAFTFNPRTRQLYLTLAEYDGGDIGFATIGHTTGAAKPRSASH